MDIIMSKKAFEELDDWLTHKDLRPFHREAISAVLQGLAQGKKTLLIEMSIGSGQHFVLVTILQYLFESGLIKKALFLTSRRQIAENVIQIIGQQTNINYGNSLKQGSDHQIISSTYNDLIKSKDLFVNYDFVVCTDIRYTKNSTITELFAREKSNICYLGMGDGNSTDKLNSFFANLAPIYKYVLQDNSSTSGDNFLNVFLQSLFIHLGYSNIQIEKPIGIGENGNEKMIYPDMVISDKEDVSIVIELKTYRNRFISRSNVNGALQQILSYKSLIKSREYILVLTCELDQEIKVAIYKQDGIQLWDIANLIYLCKGNDELLKILADQIPFSILDIKPAPIFNEGFVINSMPLYFDKKNTTLETSEALGERLKICKTGRTNKSDQEYENICVDIISFLFEQEFTQFSTQHKTNDRIFRMDLLCALKGTTAFWEFLIRHYNTKFVVFEFKNYAVKLPQNLIYVTEKYLFNAALRNVAIIISREGFQNSANIAAMGIMYP